MEIKTNNLPQKIDDTKIHQLLDDKVKQTDNVKTAIDILATKTALEQSGTVEKLVNEKTEELRNDAEAKRVKSETDRINEEVKKVLAEKQRELEEYDKQIATKKKEVEQLKAESDKAQAFFDSNCEILKYIGIRNKKSLKVMQGLMFPATIIFCIVQFLLFPLTLGGVIIETFVNIVGGICEKIKNNALKIVISILVILLIVGLIFLVYFFGGRAIVNV